MLLATLALAVVQLVAAFPSQGSAWRRMDSGLVVGNDTLSLDSAICTCICAAPSYGIARSSDSSSTIWSYPKLVRLGNLRRPKQANQPMGHLVNLASIDSKVASSSGIVVNCTRSVFIPPDSARRFVLQTRSGNWLVEAVTVNGPIALGSNTGAASFKVLWRWSSYTGNIPASLTEALPKPSRVRSTAIEPSTGRRVPLDKPLPTGVHLVAGPGGTRLVVVE